MKIHTFTIVVGTTACNAKCPYCVSRMTPASDLNTKDINWRNFDIACKFAIKKCDTVLLTGKGEPTLSPDLVSEYLRHMEHYDFAFRELQTNGIRIEKDASDGSYSHIDPHLKTWYELGLTTVSVSIAHHNPIENLRILRIKENYNFWNTVDKLHDFGFSVRINCTLTKDGVDNKDQLNELMMQCDIHNVEQTTIRMVTVPEKSENEEVYRWTKEHQFDPYDLDCYIRKHATKLLELPHGGVVYDYKGQNLCWANCLTGTTDPENIRQLIFFPNGKLRYDWRYKGAIIL